MKTPHIREIRRLALPLLLGSLLAGCAMELPITRGEEMTQQGRWEEAVTFFQEAVKQDPRNLEARLGLTRALWVASQDFVRQGNDFERVDRPEDAKAAYQRALSYNGDNQLALAGLERIVRATDIQDRLKLARERMAKKEWGAARIEVQAALRLDSENADAKALKKEIAAVLAAEAAPSKLDADTEKAAQQFFHTKPVTLRFKDTDIKEVLEVISRTSGVNIVSDESLQPKRITAFLKDVPLREAVMLILTSNRLFAKRAAENTIIVVPDNPGKRQQYDELAVQTFYLTDADAKVTVNLLRTILNTRQVFVNEKLNALVVRETPEKIELARKILEANDRNVGEVEIDLEVLEVDRTAAQNLGLDFSPRTLSVTLNFPQNIPVTSFASAIQRGSTVSITSPSLILNLVKNDSTTKVLANPTVRILDRQKARLLIGQRRPFLISSISSVGANTGGTVLPGGGATTPTGAVTTTQSNVEYRDLGLKMTLTPTVHLDGEVTVEINFEISAVGPPIADIPGANLLPPVNTRNLDTFIKVRNGETRLLGGLYQEDASVANSKMPFLSEIPVVGRLFMSPNEQRSRTDVLISLTPRIVKSMSRPDADIETFTSGTADSFGPAAPAAPGGVVAPPRPTLPTPQPSGQPSGGPVGPGVGATGPGGPAAPGASGPGPRP
jgi:general secretion pathway protein D